MPNVYHTEACERLQAVELVSSSAVEAVVVDACWYDFSHYERLSSIRGVCCTGVLRFRTSCVLGRPEPAAISGNISSLPHFLVSFLLNVAKVLGLTGTSLWQVSVNSRFLVLHGFGVITFIVSLPEKNRQKIDDDTMVMIFNDGSGNYRKAYFWLNCVS